MNLETERKMVIGLIANDEYIKRVRKIVEPHYIPTQAAKLLAQWSIEYFDKYRKAPVRDIAGIYQEKVKQGIVSKELAAEMEEDILADLSTEWEEYGINLESLVPDTYAYFNHNRLEYLKDEITVLLEKGEVDAADKVIEAYRQHQQPEQEINLSNKEELQTAVKKAFNEVYEPLIYYPGAAGELFNSQMVRGAFVAFLAPEKRGKTTIKIDAAIRGASQGNKVAVFQAGDMTENQQVRRIAIRVAGKSDKEKYCGKQYFPVRDCFYNQVDMCSDKMRECDHGVFEDKNWADIRQARSEITHEDLVEAYKAEPHYKPCYNCDKWHNEACGMPFLEERDIKHPLEEQEALTVLEEYFVTKHRNLRISTHSTGTLSVAMMRGILEQWKLEDFVPDIIIVDYADIMDGGKAEERHRQNNIWRDLRGLNQDTNTLLITATQADANSYTKDTLGLGNFSEAKTKYAHVTAFYGLNQDPQGREKKLGILRINELLLREDSFDINRQVTLLQALNIGRPIMASYF